MNLSWLAGILEGEGWVSLCLVKSNQKNGKCTTAFSPTIGMVNCDFLIMNEVCRLLDSFDIRYAKQIRPAYVGTDGSKRKPKFEICIRIHSEVRKFIEIIQPYMIGEKKDRCSHIINFLDIRANKPKVGKNSKYGMEEYNIYKQLYSYKGQRSSRSKILNDYTLEFEESNKIESDLHAKDGEVSRNDLPA